MHLEVFSSRSRRYDGINNGADEIWIGKRFLFPHILQKKAFGTENRILRPWNVRPFTFSPHKVLQPMMIVDAKLVRYPFTSILHMNFNAISELLWTEPTTLFWSAKVHFMNFCRAEQKKKQIINCSLDWCALLFPADHACHDVWLSRAICVESHTEQQPRIRRKNLLTYYYN